MFTNCILLPVGLILSMMLISKVPIIQKCALYVLNIRLTAKNDGIYDKTCKYSIIFSLSTMIITYKLSCILLSIFYIDNFVGIFMNISRQRKSVNLDAVKFKELACILIWLFNIIYSIKLRNNYLQEGHLTEKVVKRTLKDLRTRFKTPASEVL